MTWSPVDFWKYLPSSFYVTQFTYRLLTHTMWSGAILCAYALVYLFDGRKMTDLAVLLGILIIGMSHASWLNIRNMPPVSVTSAMKATLNQINNYSYKIDPGYPVQIPDMAVAQTENNCAQEKTTTICKITSTTINEFVQLPSYYYPDMLSIQVNGKQTEYFPTLLKDTNEALAAVKLDPGKNRIEIRFEGSKTANLVSLIVWIILTLFTVLWLLLLFISSYFDETWKMHLPDPMNVPEH